MKENIHTKKELLNIVEKIITEVDNGNIQEARSKLEWLSTYLTIDTISNE